MASSELKKVTIYTDGACSKNPGPGGWAAILICEGKEKEITGYDPETTNNRMELTAVIEALKALKTSCEVDLYTDSTYVANSFIQRWVYSWKSKGWKAENGMRLNYDLWEVALSLSQKHKITWHIVKGHADNEYNNRCDKLAVSMYADRKKKEAAAPFENCIIEDPDQVLNTGDFQGKTDDNGLEERVIARRNIFTGKVFTVSTMDILLPDGKTGYRELVTHRGGAAILALDEDKNVFLVEQYRTGAGRILLEIPAGKLEEGERPLDCAERELREEIGATADNVRLLTEFYVTPAYNTEKIYVYIATDLKMGHAEPDEGEFLNIKKMPLTEAIRMVAAGDITDAKTIIALTLAEKIISD